MLRGVVWGGGEGRAGAHATQLKTKTPNRASRPSRPPTLFSQQLLLSAQFLHNELPVRLAHRVAELENLPYGLSAKAHVLKVRVGKG